MLTLKKLKKMKPGIFAKGASVDAGIPIKWVAVRGDVEDWAIYYGRIDWTYDNVKNWGYKIYDKVFIKQLVPCNNEALNMYRY